MDGRGHPEDDIVDRDGSPVIHSFGRNTLCPEVFCDLVDSYCRPVQPHRFAEVVSMAVGYRNNIRVYREVSFRNKRIDEDRPFPLQEYTGVPEKCELHDRVSYSGHGEKGRGNWYPCSGNVDEFCLGDIDRVTKPVLGGTPGHLFGEIAVFHDILDTLKVGVDALVIPLLDHVAVFTEG